MTPYDFWKTTDVDGERRMAEGEWMDTRAAELMDDPDFLQRVAEIDILDDHYESNARPVVELMADIITLHTTDPIKLIGSDLLTRLYRHARHLHQQAHEAALQQAEIELDTLPQAA